MFRFAKIQVTDDFFLEIVHHNCVFLIDRKKNNHVRRNICYFRKFSHHFYNKIHDFHIFCRRLARRRLARFRLLARFRRIRRCLARCRRTRDVHRRRTRDIRCRRARIIRCRVRIVYHYIRIVRRCRI